MFLSFCSDNNRGDVQTDTNPYQEMEHDYISEDVVGRRFYETNIDEEIEEV